MILLDAILTAYIFSYITIVVIACLLITYLTCSKLNSLIVKILRSLRI